MEVTQVERPTLPHDQRKIPHQNEIYKDFRSASIPYKRDATTGEKYNYFKWVKRGDLGQEYYAPYRSGSDWPLESLPADLSEARVEVWTKKKPLREGSRMATTTSPSSSLPWVQRGKTFLGTPPGS